MELKWVPNSLCITKYFYSAKFFVGCRTMSDKIDLKRMEQNANRLLSQDGLMEMLLGAIFFASSASFSGSGSFVPFLPLYIIFMRQIVEAFRKKYTYPRIGYVKIPDEESQDVGKGILVFVGALMLVFVLGVYLGPGGFTFERMIKWLPVGIGVFLTGAFKYNIEKTGDRLNLLYIAVTVISGIGFALMEYPARDGLQFYLLFISVFFIIAGATRFISFTRKNPVLEVPSDE